MNVIRVISVLSIMFCVAIPGAANAVVSSFDSRLFTLGMSAQTHRRMVESIDVSRIQQSPVVVVLPAVAESSVRRSASSLSMFWDRENLGNLATNRSDYLAELREELAPNPASRRVDFNIVSYVNGSVTITIPELDVDLSVSFDAASVSAEQIFNSFGGYLFPESQAERSKSVSAPNVLPGTYQVTVTTDLIPATPGLSAECNYSSGALTIPEEDGGFTLEIRCGTPTKKLTASQLQAAQASQSTQVLAGPELFSVCLGNGGTDRIFGPLNTGVISQIGAGVDFVEEILELPALQNGGGEGIDLNCAGLGDASLSGSVVDEPLWSYLVSLDVLGRLDLSGDMNYTSPSARGYGDEEIDSLLSPYRPLIDASVSPYGALLNTPTHRLRFLNFSFNNFNSSAWSDLWRISDADNYSVGDILSSNNSRQSYSFAVQRDATPTALSRLQAHPGFPSVELEGLGDGFREIVELPLTETGGLVFGPFDVEEPFFEDIRIVLFDVPEDVTCLINGENTDFVIVNGFDHTGYGGTPPILISCEEQPPTTGISRPRL